jgi:predicted small metal-binding protein
MVWDDVDFSGPYPHRMRFSKEDKGGFSFFTVRCGCGWKYAALNQREVLGKVAEHQETVDNEVTPMSDDDEDRNLRERIGDAVDSLGDKIRGRDDDVDPEIKVHYLGERDDDATPSDDNRVSEDER